MIAVARKLEFARESSWDDEVEAARRFYCELLDGREIARGCFAVGGALIKTGHERRGQTARAPVRDPEGVAARCWNAGYTVVVNDGAVSSAASTIAILDPFGLRIELERVQT